MSSPSCCETDPAEPLGCGRSLTVYNRLLPYAGSLNEEASVQWSRIKEHLAKAVLLADIKDGAVYWSQQVISYLKLYGFCLSKEDHVDAVRLHYELVTMPQLELSVVRKFADALVALLSKTKLLTRDDLVLPWRPLYRLFMTVTFSKRERCGLHYIPKGFFVTYIVTSCRVYFSNEATQEMLDEWWPWLSQLDGDAGRALRLLECFLPTSVLPPYHHMGFKLWFHDLVKWYESADTVSFHEKHFINLLSRLGINNVGYIDWEPHVQWIFGRILRCSSLQVGPAYLHKPFASPPYDSKSTSQLIVSMIDKKNSVMHHLEKLVKALETYFHPSNNGSWTKVLHTFLGELVEAFLKRVFCERYRKPVWFAYFSKDATLTDDQITNFVNIVKPVTFLAMFSKQEPTPALHAYNGLACLRPELVVPELVVRLFQSLESLTEPHRLPTMLFATMAVARPMVQGGAWYPAGKLHVLQILNLILPGIDANDHYKTTGALQVIRILAMLVPMVDCSEAPQWHHELSETASELCSQTAQIQDFVFLFLDRLFVLIENSAIDHNASAAALEKASVVESFIEESVASAAQSLFRQLSMNLFEAAWEKLLSCLKSSVFEVLVSGRLAAAIALAAVEAQPQLALPALLPYCCGRICQLADEHEQTVRGGKKSEEERLDKELQWLLLLLSEVVQCNGAVLVHFTSDFEAAIDRTLHLTAKEGYEYSALAVRRFLRSLTRLYPLDMHNVGDATWDLPLSEHLPIEDWGVGCNPHKMDVKWHVPSEEELTVASRLFNKYLGQELAVLEAAASGRAVLMDRHELERRLIIVYETLSGSVFRLDPLSAEKIDLSEYAAVDTVQVPRCNIANTCNVTFDGGNTLHKVLDVMHQLLDLLLSSAGADSSKPLLELVGVYRMVILCGVSSDSNLEEAGQELAQMKVWTSNLLTKDRHLRVTAVEHARLLHELRLKENASKIFTRLHLIAYQDLFRLATSQYGDVRKRAQNVLCQGFRAYPGSHAIVLPELITALAENVASSEERFKGALSIILGDSTFSLASSKSWSTIGRLWPALVKCGYPEKPEVQKLIEDIKKKIEESFETLAISVEVTSSCIESAKKILGSEQESCLDCNAAALTKAQRHALWKSSYDNLVNTLLSASQSGSLHWKQNEIAVKMLTSLIRYDVPVSSDVGKYLTQNLVHDSYVMRKLVNKALIAVLYQQKLLHKKSWCPVDKVSCCNRSSPVRYNFEEIPDSEEKWNRTTFVDKAHFGFRGNYMVTMYESQPVVGTAGLPDESLAAFFKASGFLQKLLKLMSLVEDPKEDWFSYVHLFKGLFRNYGIGLLDVSRAPLLELLRDTNHTTEAGRHRCLSQVVCGIVRGSKFWPFNEVMALWDWLEPFLKDCTLNVSAESADHWCTMFIAVTRARDPRRLFRLFNHLLKEIYSCDSKLTSFELACRLRYLHCAVDARDWRHGELLQKSLEVILPLLTHTFQTVRNRVGRFLVSIFQHDYGGSDDPESLSPTRSSIVQLVAPELEVLQEKTNTELVQRTAPDDAGGNAPQPDKLKAMLLMKTILIWIDTNFSRMIIRNQWSADIIRLMPTIFPLVSDTSDTELRQDCFSAIARMAHPVFPQRLAPYWADAVEKVSTQQSWQGRVLLLGHMQSFIFQNLFSLSEAGIKSRVRAVLLRLLEDDQVEVRKLASETMSGALQCGYLNMDSTLLNHFYKLCATPAKAVATNVGKVQPSDRIVEGNSGLVKRHAGVLGVCACVCSCPYHVPDFLPDLLMKLTEHAHDPQPIQKTVKEAMGEFKRTHYDNWLEHKQKFSDDQLVVLTDILVSQNYYA